MKFPISANYVSVFKRRDFLILTSVIFVGQLASAFLVLSLIVSVFSRTGSNFGVSGVILSFTIPALFLMIFAGVFADIFDRRKIILLANSFIALVVLGILFAERLPLASIPLSFLYFAGNSFFIPASSAATAQLVKKEQLLVSNSVFIFVLSGGIIAGFVLGALINFIWGNFVLMIACEALLLVAVGLSFMLPKMLPVAEYKYSTQKSIENIISGFSYIFKDKVVWLYFVIFSSIQGVILFGVTLAPGFFDEIMGISIDVSPILILPLVGVGVMSGIAFVQQTKFKESHFISLGLFLMGMVMFLSAILLKVEDLPRNLQILLNVPFLVGLGFGAIIVMIAARTGLQRKIPHGNQGTVFGANIVLASLLSVFMSPFAAIVEVVLGYLGILVSGGAILILVAIYVYYLSTQWK